MNVIYNKLIPRLPRQDVFRFPEECKFTKLEREELEKLTEEGWDNIIKEVKWEVIERVKELIKNHNVIKKDTDSKNPK